MRPVVACLLALALLCAPCEGADVPLVGHGHALVVSATLNGRFTGRFLVDTGATYCVVSQEVARRAKIKGRTGGKTLRLLTANGPIEATLGEARKVEAGSASARDVAVAVTEDDPAPGLDGILGLSFLGRFTYTVDPEAGVLQLRR